MHAYINGVSFLELEKAVDMLAPVCAGCTSKKTRVCLEKCCQEDCVFCEHCSSEEHLLHHTNHINLMFIARTHYKSEVRLL